MSSIIYEKRHVTDKEHALELQGFNAHGLKHGQPPESPERFSVVAMDQDLFVGSISGLAYKSKVGYNRYFYLSDLFIEANYRRQGIASTLSKKLENQLKPLGIKHIWTWTAGFEGVGFYESQGYTVFAEMKQWYANGQSRFGFIKNLVK